MSRKRRKRKPTKENKTPATQWGWITDIRVIAGAAALIVAVLLLKTYRSDLVGLAASQDEVEPTLPVVETGAPPQPTPAVVDAPARLPEAHLDQLLAAGEPIFAFFHSNTCVQCVRMTEIVEDVYPDFSDSVALVDVDVYDEQNWNLLQRANIRVIPTLIFIDREGEVWGEAGVMEPDALREQLQTLAEE